MQHERELLNPPRAGAKEIAPLLSHWKPSYIVYVSCNRTTLAHDVDILKDNGFTLQTAGVMDMLPHTKHVSAMGLFRALLKRSTAKEINLIM